MTITLADILAVRRRQLKASVPDFEQAQFLAGIIVGLRILMGEIVVTLRPVKWK